MKAGRVSRMAIGIFVCCVMGGWTFAQGPVDVDVTVGPAGDSECTVTQGPPDISGAKRAQVIRWNIRNDCASTVTVTVDNFRHVEDNSQIKEPINFNRPPQIAPGQSGTYQGVIKPSLPNQDLGNYKYDVLINGVVEQDPRLEIDG